MTCDVRRLDELPPDVLERVLWELPTGDLENCGWVSSRLSRAANGVARRKFSMLHSQCRLAAGAWRSRLSDLAKTRSRAFAGEMASLQRKLYLAGTVLAEMDVIRAVWRGALINARGNASSIGKLLQQLQMVYEKSLEDDLPIWAPDNYYEKKMQLSSKSFIEAKVSELNLNCYFGCQLLDLLDALMDRQYKIDITFNPIENRCVIDGIYKLESPKYLCQPPILENQDEEIPTLQDKLKIYKFLLNILRINQRVILRQEQHFREFEASTENAALVWLSKEGEDRTPRLHRKGVEIREQNKYHVLRAAFSSQDVVESTITDHGLVWWVHLRCPLDAGPLSVLDAWRDMKRSLADDTLPALGEKYAARDLLRAITRETAVPRSPSPRPTGRARGRMEVENVDDFLPLCPILSEFRVRWLGKHVLSLSETLEYLNDEDWKALAGYCKAAWKYCYSLIIEYNN